MRSIDFAGILRALSELTPFQGFIAVCLLVVAASTWASTRLVRRVLDLPAQEKASMDSLAAVAMKSMEERNAIFRESNRANEEARRQMIEAMKEANAALEHIRAISENLNIGPEHGRLHSSLARLEESISRIAESEWMPLIPHESDGSQPPSNLAQES